MRTYLSIIAFSCLAILAVPVYAATWYVPDNYATIQDAIDSAVSGDTIIVRANEYTGAGNTNIDFKGIDITLKSESGPVLTVINCQDSGRAFYLHSNESSIAMIEGFTIKNGFATGVSPNDQGGGIYCSYSSPTIKNCIFRNNSATLGGGIFSANSSPVLIDCTFADNSAASGGGIWNSSGSPQLTNCMFDSNTANDGGGMYNKYSASQPTLKNCIFKRNSAINSGGGIYEREGPSSDIFNSVFSNNSAIFGGGIYTIFNCNTILVNCTFNNNSASTRGGGLRIYTDSAMTVTNTILWGDTSPQGPEIAMWGNASIDIDYSDVDGGETEILKDVTSAVVWGENNIESNPVFVAGIMFDYYLSQTTAGESVTSPCVDSGSDTAVSLGLQDLTTRTDGVGDAGVVDMGFHAPYPPWIDSIVWSAGNVTIHWNARPGVGYYVQSSVDLDYWEEVYVGETTELIDSGASPYVKKFYRVREE